MEQEGKNCRCVYKCNNTFSKGMEVGKRPVVLLGPAEPVKVCSLL